VSRRAGHLGEGSATFVAGLLLWLFTQDVELPVLTPAKAGIVMMCAGGAQVLWGLCRPPGR
jgi:hypothetical protein